MNEFEKHLRSAPYASRVSNLTLKIEDDNLIAFGQTSSYYNKQMLGHQILSCLKELGSSLKFSNEVEVR